MRARNATAPLIAEAERRCAVVIVAIETRLCQIVERVHQRLEGGLAAKKKSTRPKMVGRRFLPPLAPSRLAARAPTGQIPIPAARDRWAPAP